MVNRLTDLFPHG